MQKRLYIEKKDGFEDSAQNIYRFLTEKLRIHDVTSVRVLRVLFLDGGEDCFPALSDGKKFFYMEPETEYCVPEDTIRFALMQKENLCVCTLPLFLRTAEVRMRDALRLSLGRDGLWLRQAELVVVSGVPEADRERIRNALYNPSSAVLLSPDLREGAPLFSSLLPMDTRTEDPALFLRGFRKMEDIALLRYRSEHSFRMTGNDMRFVRSYFSVEERRDPTLMELRMIDTYWSDHCRHVTFLTALDDFQTDDPYLARTFEAYLRIREEVYGTRPKNITLMDIATLPAKYLRRCGMLTQTVETTENNAFTVRVPVDEGEERVPWLLSFKNETHNHPTEKEPFLGALTSFASTVCDPLSARAEVFCGMRLSGCAEADGDAEKTVSEGHLLQTAIANEAADGFSAFGMQCGIPVGLCYEWNHPGYHAKHMEVCLVAAAAPDTEERKPQNAVTGDVLLIIGAPTGRDGLGGALHASIGSGSFEKRYMAQVADTQTERNLLRMMRRADTARYVKRANDVGAGGIGVAAAELADGIRVDLDAVPLTAFDGIQSAMNPYEIAISETPGRILLVCASVHAKPLLAIAESENLTAAEIGIVTAERRFRLVYHERTMLSLSRDFLDSNGAERRIGAVVRGGMPEQYFSSFATAPVSDAFTHESAEQIFFRVLSSPEVRSQRPLSRRYDAEVGGRAVTRPFVGRYEGTPLDYMAYRFPVQGKTDTCAVFSFGFMPELSEISPYHGGYYAVLLTVCRMVAAGMPPSEIVLSMQEYFPAVKDDPRRYGVPLAALLGAFAAQLDLGIASVGGKDSMNGTDGDEDVPPTLICFGVSHASASALITPEFKSAGKRVYLLSPAMGENHIPDAEDMRELLRYVHHLTANRKADACLALGAGGIGAGIAKMGFGNRIGFNFESTFTGRTLFLPRPGSFLVACDEPIRGTLVGYTKDAANLLIGNETLPLTVLEAAFEKPNAKRYMQGTEDLQPHLTAGFLYHKRKTDSGTGAPAVKTGNPAVLIPVFPGITGEDTLCRRFSSAGFEVKTYTFCFRTVTEIRTEAENFANLLKNSDVFAIGGGAYPVYGTRIGSYPDSTAMLIAAFFDISPVAAAIRDFRRNRHGLTLGLGEGFRVLCQTGFFDDETGKRPFSLTGNRGLHPFSGRLYTKVMSVSSPWMRYAEIGELAEIPVASVGGRCVLDDETILRLAENGQIASQYTDDNGNPTMDVRFNPFGSDYAVEGIFSSDGTVFGRMGYCDRTENAHSTALFRAAKAYFSL